MTVAEVESPPATETASPEFDRVDSPAPGGPHLPYFPGLDGLRAVAVIAVLFFHGGFAWAVGGYLGVSTFFTLSGFLITSLLLAERAHSGRVDLKAFWIRRFRRLMPASLAALTFVLVFGLVVADSLQRRNLAGDVVACLAYVANWRFIFSQQSYADLFAAPSPVLHFWSLAIEEQFYLFYPLLIGGLVNLGRVAARSRSEKHRYWLNEAGLRYRRVIGTTLVVLTLGSFALMRWGDFSHNAIYLGTPTRASELLIGCLLATLLFNVKVTSRIARPGPIQTAVAVVGTAAFATCLVLWSKTPNGTDWLYAGGFTLYAMLSAAVIVAAILPMGPVAWLLSVRPLRYLGRVSYGVYLYHWPVFLWLRAKTTLAPWPRFALGVAITLVMAELSFRYLETPIRKGRKLLHLRPVRIAPVAIATIAVFSIVLTRTAPPPVIDFASAQQEISQLTADAAASAATAPPTTVDPSSLVAPLPRVAFFGDSTALMTSWGVSVDLQSTGKGVPVDGFSGLGCSVISLPERRVAGKVEKTDPTCNDWPTMWKKRLDTNKPTLAVVQSGPWDIPDRKLPGDTTWRGPGDPVFDDYLLGQMGKAVDVLAGAGAQVIWLTSSPQGAANKADPKDGYDEPGRMKRYNELVEQLPQTRPGKVAVVDLASWVANLSDSEDARMRPDGVHFTRDTSVEVAQDFLAGAVLSAYNDAWVAKKRAELGEAKPLQTLVVGDGTASQIGLGLGGWSKTNGRMAVRSLGQANCGIGRHGQRLDKATPEPTPDECNHWDSLFPTALAGTPADIVVVHTGVWDVTDRKLDDWPDFKAIGDPSYDNYLRDEFAKAADTLHQTGAPVMWLLSPHIDWGRTDSPPPSQPYPASDPSRVDRLNDLIREVAQSRPWMIVVDYAAFARSWPGGEFDQNYRPDGVQPTAEGATKIAEWLAPLLLDDYARVKTSGDGSPVPAADGSSNQSGSN